MKGCLTEEESIHTDVWMPHEAQVAIVRRVLAHLKNKTTDAQAESRLQPVTAYTCKDRYQQEQERLFRRAPLLLGPSSLLPGPNRYITIDDYGVPLIVSRDSEGTVRALVNVCRHRGSRLMHKPEGRAKCFACPYHAWTYDGAGQLAHVPHMRGFPVLNERSSNLVELPLVERHGGLWVCLDASAPLDVDAHLGSLADEFAGLNLAHHQVYERREEERALNWKLAVEGFLEAYHIRSTHKDTFYSVVFDNLALHDVYGPHSRTIYPLRKIVQFEKSEPTAWGIRRTTSIIYHLFPNTIIAVEPYHVCMLGIIPLSESRTRLRSTILVAPDKLEQQDRMLEDIAMLQKGLSEDYVIGESIQAGIASGVNTHFHFGQFEGGLSHFHQTIERMLG